MLINYSLTQDFPSSPWDWIGLYKVMWGARMGIPAPLPLWFIHPEGLWELDTETKELTQGLSVKGRVYSVIARPRNETSSPQDLL